MRKLLFIFLVIMTFSLTGCSGNGDAKSDSPVMNVEMKKDANGNSHKIENGNYQCFYTVSKGKTGCIRVTTETAGGSIDVKISNVNDASDVPYTGNNLGNASFTVNLPKTGEYKVWVTCKDFEGKYNFEYVE